MLECGECGIDLDNTDAEIDDYDADPDIGLCEACEEELEQEAEGIENPIPEMQEVESSNLYQVSYSRRRERLFIRFTSGALYQYFAVPESEYIGLMDAESHGVYFHANIRDVYDYEQIE